ncbi:hypothetical protein MKW94_009786 [Papaver nudicaule]|uniref:Uncharacterized protein n=1 Tax=Papaver nudicaule TaxID=74823 RepID=A0AA41S1Q4_PAPNU|nr:hypothetical protein [Papaver nudicaule]
MAKATALCFSPFFLGLLMMMSSRGVTADCVDFKLTQVGDLNHNCKNHCKSYFGDKLLSFELHDPVYYWRDDFKAD